MSLKSDILGYGILLGGVALAGYVGYRAIGSLFPAGAAGGLFSNPESPNAPLNQYKDMLDESTKASSETSQETQRYEDVLNQTTFLDVHPEYQQALNDYQKELKDYEDAQNALAGVKVYNFFHTAYTPEYSAAYALLTKEYGETLASFHKVNEIYSQVIAQ